MLQLESSARFAGEGPVKLLDGKNRSFTPPSAFAWHCLAASASYEAPHQQHGTSPTRNDLFTPMSLQYARVPKKNPLEQGDNDTRLMSCRSVDRPWSQLGRHRPQPFCRPESGTLQGRARDRAAQQGQCGRFLCRSFGPFRAQRRKSARVPSFVVLYGLWPLPNLSMLMHAFSLGFFCHPRAHIHA